MQDYPRFGVPAIWVIDPVERKVWIYRPNEMTEATGEFIKVDGTDIQVPLSEIFD